MPPLTKEQRWWLQRQQSGHGTHHAHYDRIGSYRRAVCAPARLQGHSMRNTPTCKERDQSIRLGQRVQHIWNHLHQPCEHGQLRAHLQMRQRLVGAKLRGTRYSRVHSCHGRIFASTRLTHGHQCLIHTKPRCGLLRDHKGPRGRCQQAIHQVYCALQAINVALAHAHDIRVHLIRGKDTSESWQQQDMHTCTTTIRTHITPGLPVLAATS
jgi:hypothetical protein